jgi:hypothetical protein
MAGLGARLNTSIWALLKATDTFVLALIQLVLYPLNLCDAPTGRRMISSYVGRAAFNGRRWAQIVGALIDRGATLLGDAPDHCYRMFRFYEGLDD